ncbi:hypothetical protein TYRP_015059 [Tyrophagus putrescentiae]|nr:hypothetical protein TYRP_015059 [Tyrophagus putrescentiae]
MNRADVQRAIHIYSPKRSLPLHWVFLNRMLPYEWGHRVNGEGGEGAGGRPSGLKWFIYNGDLDTICRTTRLC